MKVYFANFSPPELSRLDVGGKETVGEKPRRLPFVRRREMRHFALPRRPLFCRVSGMFLGPFKIPV